VLERALHRSLIVIATEELKQSVAVMRQVGMQSRPATVAAAIKSGDCIVMIVGILAIDSQVTFAAEFNRSVAHLDAHALAALGA
jgi:hypothetical protein